MLFKIAFSANTPLQVLQKESATSNNLMMRTASGGKIILEQGTEKARIIEAEIKKHPKALFFRAKAIEADRQNTNGDFFSTEELLKAYKSFEGVPFFTNHDNQDVEKARGKIVFAEWVPEEKAVYTIAFVDRDAYPHICRSIEEEYVTGVSMGASVEYSVCSICENVAERTEDYCGHIKNRKGRKFTGSARNVKTGEIKQFNDEPVFEYNYGVKFIELSAVVDPACPDCRIQGIIPNTDYFVKAASLENSLFMVKTAALEKKASQEEIQQIDQALATLETISINLIKNRKQIEVEFASDLVDIIAQLQTWMDELVGAGYANINLGEANVPGTAGNAPAPESPPPAPPGAGSAGSTPATLPSSAGGATAQPASSGSAGAAGTVTGSPSQPLVQGPSLPITAPIRPKSSANSMIRTAEERKEMLNKIVQSTTIITEKMNINGEEDMAKRRTIGEKQVQIENAKKVLSESWQEKQHFIEYIKEVPSVQNTAYKLSVKRRDDSFIIVAEEKNTGKSKAWSYEDLTTEDRDLIKQSPKTAAVKMLQSFIKNQNQKKEGVTRMSENKKQAGAASVNSNTEVITEKQLDQAGLYHSRTGEEKDQITQAQLESLRTNKEAEVITEKQLNEGIKLHPRTNEEIEVITEKQLTGDNRLNDEKDQITERQLDSQRVDNEQDVITEKQLNEVKAPWARAASRDPKLFKSAGDHMNAVLSALADTALETGATPEELQKIAREMVSGVKARYTFASAILDKAPASTHLPFSKRASFWSSKKISVASASPAEVENIFVGKMQVIASDQTISPDVLIDAVEVVGEDENGLKFLNKRIDEKLAEASKGIETKPSVKAELRSFLSNTSENKTREEKREAILASLNKDVKSKQWEEVAKKDLLNADKIGSADMVIKTSMQEVDTKKDSKTFKKDVYAFTKGALASQNLKMAAITNVTISGDTIQIAVQTDEGDESVNIPIGGEGPAEGETAPEGDLSGEGMDATLGASPTAAPEASATPPATASAPLPPPTASSKKQIKTAQAPMGGGAPGAPNAGMNPDPSGGVPGGAPMDQKPVEALMGDKPAEGDESIPTVGEKQPPWTVCPECGESDVDVLSEENGDIKAVCKNPSCGAEYTAMVEKTVKFKITKPAGEKAEGAGAAPEAPEAPEVPALPVAASTKVTEKSFIRIASNKKAHGHVCPACGNKHCKAAVDTAGHAECTCDKCHTGFTKDLLVNTNKPKESLLTVQWDISPDVNCPECVKKAMAFASKVKAENIIRTASDNKDKFPMANCAEWVARTYGGDTMGSFGPCKGKVLADCVCKQLQKLGFSKVRHLKKLATASLQKDPMDECIEDQMKKNYSRKEASSICGCIQKKFANKMNTSILVQAFAEDIENGKEPGLNVTDLVSLDELLQGENWDGKVYVDLKKEDTEDEGDIGASLPPMDSVDVDVDVVPEGVMASKKAPVKTAQAECKKCDKCKKCCGKDCKCEGDKCTCKPEGEKVASTKETLEQKGEDMNKEDMLMSSSRVRRTEGSNIRLAEKPTVVKDIEGNVEAGVPRKEQYLGKEKEADSMINKQMAQPNVPRKDAYMGKEKEADSMINATLELPDVAKDSSFMGHEQEVQSGMPAINNEIKGTVIATTDKTKKQAKKMKEVDTVEGDVEAGVPRAKATMGKEGPDNIDVKMADPQVPRAKATMGEEGPDNIDVKMESPDVPIDNAYMGHEKEVQKDMPPINDKYLKQVKMDRQVQLDRIAIARRESARDTAAWLAANGRIASDKESFDSVVTALCAFEIDKIQKVAEQMFPERVKKTSSSEKPEGHAIPAIVMESKKAETGLADKLASAFTIGNSKFDKQLTIYGEK